MADDSSLRPEDYAMQIAKVREAETHRQASAAAHNQTAADLRSAEGDLRAARVQLGAMLMNMPDLGPDFVVLDLQNLEHGLAEQIKNFRDRADRTRRSRG
jgi:hypothetical protein